MMSMHVTATLHDSIQVQCSIQGSLTKTSSTEIECEYRRDMISRLMLYGKSKGSHASSQFSRENDEPTQSFLYVIKMQQ
jgi:hypothetical protein